MSGAGGGNGPAWTLEGIWRSGCNCYRCAQPTGPPSCACQHPVNPPSADQAPTGLGVEDYGGAVLKLAVPVCHAAMGLAVVGHACKQRGWEAGVSRAGGWHEQGRGCVGEPRTQAASSRPAHMWARNASQHTCGSAVLTVCIGVRHREAPALQAGAQMGRAAGVR